VLDSIIGVVVAAWLVHRLARMKEKARLKQLPDPKPDVPDDVANKPVRRRAPKYRNEFGPFDDEEIARNSVPFCLEDKTQ
jgi:hypothetical protein